MTRTHHQPASGNRRVGYLLSQYPSPTQTFIRREIAALERLGWEVVRYTIRSPHSGIVDPADIAELERTSVVVDGHAARNLVRAVALTCLRRPAGFARAIRRAWALSGGGGLRRRAVGFGHLAEACIVADRCRRDKVGHLHTHFATNAPAVALLVTALVGTSFSITIHGPDDFECPDGLNVREKVAAAAFVVAISSFGRSQIFRWSDVGDWPKVHIVRCGVDAQFLEHDDAAPPPSSDRRFVCVGRLSAQKGPLVLVEAVTRLRDAGRPVEVVMIGDGDLRPNIEQAIADAGLGDLIKLPGWGDGATVRAELLDSRGLVLSSFGEGLPVVIMESLALQRPVIATAVAGVPELVDDECGWVVPAGSVERLAEALDRAASASIDELQRMGENGRRRVLELHDSDTETERLAGYFAEVIGAR